MRNRPGSKTGEVVGLNPPGHWALLLLLSFLTFHLNKNHCVLNQVPQISAFLWIGAKVKEMNLAVLPVAKQD